MLELKRISHEAIERSLAKAERYRADTVLRHADY